MAAWPSSKYLLELVVVAEEKKGKKIKLGLDTELTTDIKTRQTRKKD